MTSNQYDAIIGNQIVDDRRQTIVYSPRSIVFWSQPYAK
jgi:hypothetical protein